MKKQIDMKWEDIQRDGELGLILNMFRIGDQDDESAPTVLRTVYPPGWTVSPHSHDPDYAEIVLEGSVQVTRRWYHEGDIRIVKGGTVYGPVIAGPDGATVLIIFRGGIPINRPPKPDGQIVRSITPLDQLV
jgi:quercetin dioxygenase-like cupin family protein